MAASGQPAGFRVRSIDWIVAMAVGSTLVAGSVLALGSIFRATLGFDRPFAELLGLATVAVPAIPLVAWLAVRHRRALDEVGRAQRIERALVERGGDLIVNLSGDGTVLSCAGSLAERLGCADAGLAPGDWHRWMHPDDRDRCDAQLARCLEQQAPGTIVYRGSGADGRRLSIEATIFPLVDDRGRPDGFVVRHRDVSGTVGVRDELAEQSERMALAQRAGRVGVWEYSTADRRLVLSELLRHALGLAKDANVPVDVARTWIDVAQFARLEAAVRRSDVHDADLSLALDVTPPDGVQRRFAIRATTSRDGTGRIQRVIGTAVDVTQESRQRELLAKNEWILITLIEHAPLALVMCDRSLRCVRASRAWCERFLGQQPAPEGRPLRELLPGPWAHWEARCTEALDGVRQRSDEDAVLVAGDPASAGAGVRWLRWEIIPWSGERGEIDGIIMTLEDVGPRKAAELAAAAARTALDASEAAAKVGSWRYDLRSGAVTWSRETYRLFGHDESHPPPDYEGILATYESASAARLDAAVRRAVTEAIPYDVVLQLRSPTRGARFVNARGHPVMARGGSDDGISVEALAGTVRDVTSEVEREEELRRAREAAEQGNRAKGEFLASMSHEIRTPLTAILGYAELLAADPEIQVDVQRRQAAAETIRNNAKHLLAIINDLLDLSKIEAGKLVVEHLPTNVAGVVADVLNLLGPAARAKGLSIGCDSTIHAKQLMLTDPIRLRQVLVNLVGNAIKFTERGGVTLSLALTAPQISEGLNPRPVETGESTASARGEVPMDRRRELVISVGDTGIGMTPETLQRIFGAFEQADASTSRKFGGTGLGLRISRRLAELLGGRLDVGSTYAVGSTFTLRLPVVLLPPR